jgi:hypothetical protein
MKVHAKAALILLALGTVIASTQSPAEDKNLARDTQSRGYWVDPSTGLMWPAKDNGNDVSFKKAIKYCHNLRLAGYSDWKLANMAELQGIFDRTVEAPGLAGYQKKLRVFTWHVKGNLFLTGDQWSSNFRVDDRGHYNGYAYYFDFNEGKPNDDPSGWPYSSAGRRALCVRSSVK